jgi:hypothetical protein
MIMKVLAVMPGKKPVKMELNGALKAMQTFVGGSIQAVYPFDDSVAIVCNEEGKLLGMEYTRALWDDSGAIYDILCGPFFLCGLGKEDFTSLSETLIEKYYKHFEHPELFVRVSGNLVVMRA